MQNFIDTITARGFVHQMTDEAGLRALLATPGQRAYIGFDCTAKSLHVGSLLQIMLLRWWQKCGHTPIVLLGGGTTKIGDPSGKDESRPKLDDAAIAENMHHLKQVFSQFISFEADAALMLNNDDWLKGLNYIEFLRDYGRHFSVNRMMTMDSVKLRLERDQHLSFLEFNYMILQAYDFAHMARAPKDGGYNCRVQMGGSDQWGNITQGIDLDFTVQKPIKNKKVVSESKESFKSKGVIHYLYHNFANEFTGCRIREATAIEIGTNKFELTYTYVPKVFGITSPLITTSSGAKMGKTAAGAVWLNADLCSPYDYWQFWRNTEDGDVIRFLKLFTELSLEQIAEYEGWVGSAKINDAKIILATEATALLHGRGEAEKAAKTAADTFSGNGVSDNLPELLVESAKLEAGIAVFELLVMAGFAASNGEARKLIQGNGVRLNDDVVADDKARVTSAQLKDGFAKLSKGKKQHVLVKAA